MVTRAQTGIDRRIVRCVDQMYNLRALFAASRKRRAGRVESITSQRITIRQGDLGIRSIGYIEKVSAADKDAFLKRRQRTGTNNFAISPEGERPVYYPAVYLTIFGPNDQLIRGTDHGVQPERLAMIERAIDEDKPFATEKVNFLLPDGKQTNFGIALYLPIYRKGLETKTVDERREAVQGIDLHCHQVENRFCGIARRRAPIRPTLEFMTGTARTRTGCSTTSTTTVDAGHPERSR